jgi:hypothetical protein
VEEIKEVVDREDFGFGEASVVKPKTGWECDKPPWSDLEPFGIACET